MSALGRVLFQSCVYQSNFSGSTVAGRWSDFPPEFCCSCEQLCWSLWWNEGCKWLFCLLTEGSNSACVCRWEQLCWSLWCNEGRKLLFCLLTEGSNSTCVCSVSSCSYVMKDCWLREVTLHAFAGVRAEPRGSADAWLHAFSPSGLCYLFPWRHRPGYFNTGKLFAFILYRDTDLDILT